MSYTPSGNYNFVGVDSYTPDGDFVLGDISGNAEGNISATLDDVSSDIIGYSLQNLGIWNNTTLEGVTAGIVGEYDPNVNRLTVIEPLVTYEDAWGFPPEIICSLYEQASYTSFDVCSVTESGFLLHDTTCMIAENGTWLDDYICSVHETGEFTLSKTCFAYEQGTFIDNMLCSTCEDGSWTEVVNDIVMEQMTKIYPDQWCIPYLDSNRQYDFLHPVMLEPFPPNDNPNGDDYVFGNTDYIPSGDFNFNFGRSDNLVIRQIWGVVTTTYNAPSSIATYFDERYCVIAEEAKHPEPGKTPWVDLSRPDPDPDPPSGTTITVPDKEVYTVLNTITVTLDDGTTPIQLSNIFLSIDADSSTWSFNADLLDPNEIGLVKQLPDGTAIKLFITINGTTWHVLVEKIQTNRVFGNQSVKISGRGLTALMSKPYEQPVSVNIGSDTDIRVLVDNLLPLGWNDLGDLYWLLGDDPVGSPKFWIVDGGAFSYQNQTPIEAIKQVAEDIGVMLVPSTDSQELYFKSRYPILPWNFDSVSVDVEIPDSAIIQISEEPVSSFQANGVYLHGNEIGGELAFVRLNGTAGDRLAPTINNNLMTDVIALRGLGERVLSGQYAQPKIKSITTFMDGTTVPFMNLGTFVGLTVDAVETRGVVNAVTINARHSEVSQIITIGEATPNNWVAFKEILPKDPMLVGTLTSTDGDTSLMILLDGGVVRVRGTGNVNGKYYIRSGEIVSDAPNLTQYEIVL